jgi:hypothetical protein
MVQQSLEIELRALDAFAKGIDEQAAQFKMTVGHVSKYASGDPPEFGTFPEADELKKQYGPKQWALARSVSDFHGALGLLSSVVRQIRTAYERNEDATTIEVGVVKNALNSAVPPGSTQNPAW